MAFGIWGVIKTAATKIPWWKIAENAPLVVDLVGRAKDRFGMPSQKDFAEQIKSLQEENVRLAKVAEEMAAQMEELTASLKIVSSRLAVMTVVALIASLISIATLVYVAVK